VLQILKTFLHGFLLVNTLALISEKMQLIMFCLTTFNFYSLEFCLILLASVSDFAETSRFVPSCLALSAPPLVTRS